MHFMVFVLFVLHVLLFDQVFAQPRKPATISEISTYMGADREQLLYAGAKSEGVVKLVHLAGGRLIQGAVAHL